jgi:Ca2+-binding EF-hand superfamily protein
MEDKLYAETLIAKYGKNKDLKAINFVEFTKLMEDLWSSADSVQQKTCETGFKKAQSVFEKLFQWLDRDGDGQVTREDMVYGISRIMIKDVEVTDVDKVIAEFGGKYGAKAPNKVSENGFLLAVANGKFDNSFKDPMFKETFIK